VNDTECGEFSRRTRQDLEYQGAVAAFGPALSRLAFAYEEDAVIRSDLLQEIHLALWRSFASFDGRCSTKTWVFRVAHNVAASHVVRRTRLKRRTLITLDELECLADGRPTALVTAVAQQAFKRLADLIQQLDPLDRQIIVAYLEEMDAAAIGEMTGLSSGAIATKIYRIKRILAQRFNSGSQTTDG